VQRLEGLNNTGIVSDGQQNNAGKFRRFEGGDDERNDGREGAVYSQKSEGGRALNFVTQKTQKAD
jgi:hypothetical protein